MPFEEEQTAVNSVLIDSEEYPDSEWIIVESIVRRQWYSWFKALIHELDDIISGSLNPTEDILSSEVYYF